MQLKELLENAIAKSQQQEEEIQNSQQAIVELHNTVTQQTSEMNSLCTLRDNLMTDLKKREEEYNILQSDMEQLCAEVRIYPRTLYAGFTFNRIA